MQLLRVRRRNMARLDFTSNLFRANPRISFRLLPITLSLVRNFHVRVGNLQIQVRNIYVSDHVFLIRRNRVCNFARRKLLILGHALVIGIDESLKQMRHN